jgi:cellulose synthase/poly-beta-1,6-N-acetylglucosamine synthase-like glycosyltransferase
MTAPALLLLGLYFTILVCLSVYGLHRCYLVYLYTKYRRSRSSAAASAAVSAGGVLEDFDAPFVTVQLPIYNEMYVVDRLVDAVAGLDYPHDRLQIQVLDDSTDDTQYIARRAVSRAAARGLDIQYLHRSRRAGFKAGALADGLQHARGELIAIFDADFVPEADFLARVLSPFRDPRVGMVQARWGHINRDYSLLTRVQAMFLDAHFVLEHGARERAGLFFNFNGTAGVWRREAIESAGGWQHDTLTEDLDLSYRAQMAGWRFVFLPDVVAPAEVPVEMNGFKTQQHRWARGSIQTGLKILPVLLRSSFPRRVKLEAFFHLTANLNHPLMLALSVIMVPALFVRETMGATSILLVDLPLFCAATLSMVNFYTVSQRTLRTDWISQLRYMPALMAVGIGLSVNNTRAVIGARSGRETPFKRTAKYGVVGRGDDWLSKRYRQSAIGQPMIELGLGLYFTVAIVYAASSGLLASLPFLMLFQAGFLYTGLQSFLQQSANPDLVLSAQVAGE